MNSKVYNLIYSILVNEAGANETGREHFVYVFMHDPPREYRFQGNLGFGGKLWMDHDGFRVTCYREDEDGERMKTIDKVNALLREVYEEEKRGAFE